MIRIKKPRKQKNQNQRRSLNEIFNNNAISNIPYPYWMEWDRRMKRVIRNLATVSPSYDGQAKGSCSVYLNGTDQSVPVPITSDVSYITWMNPIDGTYETLAPQNDGGASSKELVANGDFSDGDDGWEATAVTSSYVSDSNFHMIGTTYKYATLRRVGLVIDPNKTYFQAVNLVAFTTLGIRIPDGSAPYLEVNTLGESTYISDGTANPKMGELVSANSVGQDITIGSVSLKQVLPLSTTYSLTESWQNLLVTSVAVTDADRTYMENYPEALVNMVLTSVDNGSLSFGVADIEHYYLNMASDNVIYDLVGTSDLAVTNGTDECRTHASVLNTQIGTSNLALIRDASGRPTAPVDANTLAFNASGENVDTEFKPSLNIYTIKEVVIGLLADLDSSGDPLGTFSQRAEYRELKHDKDGLDEYWIDNVLQGYVPPLPDPATVIKLNNTAVIGHADERDLTNCQFKVYTEILTPEESTADFNDWFECSENISINFIEQENGYCTFSPGGSCTEPILIVSNIYTAHAPSSYLWTVDGATIEGSNTGDYVSISTPVGSTSVTYTVTLDVVINGVPLQYIEEFTQVKETTPIQITDIDCSIEGSCNIT